MFSSQRQHGSCDWDDEIETSPTTGGYNYASVAVSLVKTNKKITSSQKGTGI